MDTGAQFGNTEQPTNGHTTPSKADHIIAAPDGEGCPRCGGYVYHADQVFSKGRAWHKGCFKCNKCHRVLDSRIACDGPDNDVYCTDCKKQLKRPLVKVDLKEPYYEVVDSNQIEMKAADS